MQSTADCNNTCFLPPLSLASFQYFSILSFSQPTQTKPFDLSSVTAPFGGDLCAVVVTACGSISMVVILVRLSGKWDVFQISLAVLAGIVGKSGNGRGNFRFQLCYSIWLLFVGFTSLGYTNVLQSILVVPRVQHNDHKLAEMFQENFFFEILAHLTPLKIEPTRSVCTGARLVKPHPLPFEKI